MMEEKIDKVNEQLGKWIYGPMDKKMERRTPGVCIIKFIRAAIYGFCNKLECLSLNIRKG
jgi:hypothetical protein